MLVAQAKIEGLTLVIHSAELLTVSPAMGHGARHVLLVTGVPGVGKTTLLRRVAEKAERRLGGFTTEEMRKRGQRVGFRIVPLGGSGRVMAHIDLGGRARVGRYGVDIAAIDAVAEATLALDPGVEVYLVDEIGKMECFSSRFVAAMRCLLDSDRLIVTSIARTGGGFIAEVKRRQDVDVWEVTARNRDALVDPILEWIASRSAPDLWIRSTTPSPSS
jgi:nucleoside-triphosphatase